MIDLKDLKEPIDFTAITPQELELVRLYTVQGLDKVEAYIAVYDPDYTPDPDWTQDEAKKAKADLRKKANAKFRKESVKIYIEKLKTLAVEQTAQEQAWTDSEAIAAARRLFRACMDEIDDGKITQANVNGAEKAMKLLADLSGLTDKDVNLNVAPITIIDDL